MRGTGRPIIIPKEVVDAPLRIPNAFKNQIKATITGASGSSEGRASVKESSDRRPTENGGSSSENKTIENSLLKLDILFSGPMEDLVIYRILDVLISRDARNNEDLSAIAVRTANKTLIDSTNIISICKYVYLFSLLPEKGPYLRTQFFNRLQSQFQEERHSLKKTPQYVNFVRFLMASVHYCRNPLVPVAEVFISSCLTVLQEMGESTEENEIKAAAELFIKCVEQNQGSNSELQEQLVKAKNVIRNCLATKDSLTAHSRLWLMLALEYSGGSVSPDMIKFYSGQLGCEEVEIEGLLRTDFKFVIPKGDAARFPLTRLKLQEFVSYV